MNRYFFIILFALLSALNVSGRETIKGTVTDSHGEPMPGVKVEIPGSSEFVFTDLDGAFQIILREPAKNLNFSYPGFGTVSHRVRPEMNVVFGKGWSGREKGYRFLLDLEGGMGINGNVTIKSGDSEVRDIHTFMMSGLTQTHGYQFNRHLFVGIGFGAYLELMNFKECYSYDIYSEIPISSLQIPLFVSARWDFGLTKKTAPYVGLRAGIGRSIAFDDGYFAYVWNNGELEVTNENCSYFFITPSVGYRMSIHNKFAMNLGFSCMLGRKNKFSAHSSYYDSSTGTDYSFDEVFTQRASDVIFFNIGFDF